MNKINPRLLIIAILGFLGMGLGNCYATIVTDTSGDIVIDTSSDPVSDTNGAPPARPSITSQPANATVTAPATATFTVVATGNPAPTYQWQQEAPGAGSFTAISGATSASYTTPATTLGNSGTQYECVITNLIGNVTTNAATLTVNILPSITTQPVNAAVIAPATATFTVAATGSPSPIYQWQQEASGAGSFTAISGATSASYTTPATTAGNNGTQYECVVTNSAGNVTSNAATLTVSSLPVVSITSPANNSTVQSGSNVTITASASETNGSISSVAFYNGTTLLSTSTTSPYSYTLSNVSTGTYNLTTVATDSNGIQTTSTPVTLFVSGQPVVTMTSPVNGSYWISTSPVAFTVNASEANGTIVQVNYLQYEGGSSYSQIGSSTTPPFTLNSNLSIGSYQLVAVAIDSYGQSTMTPRASITVTGPPTVAIASPVNQSTLTTGSVNITAIAGESNGGMISSVAFYNGTTVLGTVTSTSQAFTYTWPNISSGTYNITAVATDTEGNTVTSAPVAFTINSVTFTNMVDNNIASKTDARGNTTSYQYDNLNRLLKTTFADNSSVSYAYDAFGNQTSITDQRNNVLTKTYDAYERLSQTKDPLNGTTQFNYDTNGDLLTLTDANNHSTTYTYDGDYRVLTQTNPLNYTTTYTYDPNGNVASREDANGKTTNYTYDALNRLTNTAYPDSTSVANVYDALGRKTSMTDATGQTTYSYDALSRLLTKASPGTSNTITYTYDYEGDRLTSVDQNNRTITNTYDTLNRLASVTDPNGTTNYGYDAVSNKISAASPNGVTESYTYDALNRVLTDVNAKGSTVISSFSNVYDVAGMITKKTFSDGSWTAYSYDALNRLLEETKQTSSSTIYDYVYTYDPVGNRLTWTNNGTVRSYSYDAGNRLSYWSFTASGITQTDSYTYDNNGNRTAKQVAITGQLTQQISYAYDFENRLNQLQYVNIPGMTGNETDSLVYNGEGLRTQAVLNSVTANYLYDGSNILVERDGSNNTTKSYTRGLDLGGGIGSLINQNYTNSGTAVTQYYDYNDLGSVVDTTTTTGAPANDYSYDAFGNLLTSQASGDTNRYLFSTKELDSRSGLEYFGRRYYDPEVGRWITPDPLGFINGPNPYLYTGNNPINYIDPYGLYWGEDQVDWWLYQSVVPGPYGQPVSQWGPNGPTEWGNIFEPTDAAGGNIACAERILYGTAVGATAIASGAMLADWDPWLGDIQYHPWDPGHPYPHIQFMLRTGSSTTSHFRIPLPWKTN